MKAPKSTVVVSTRDRARSLRTLLEALGEAPVVVVADGATPEVHAVLAEFPAVRVLRHERSRGPAAGRNTGWRAVQTEYVAFTDDDCRPETGWLAALEARAAPRTVVQGRVVPEGPPGGPFDRTLAVDGAGPWYQTANILYPRALLEELGGFDEAFPFPAGEDTDLGWRALEAGARAVFAPDAVVRHAVHALSVRDAVRAAAKWGTTVRVVRRHPGVRAHLHHRYFFRSSHERLLAAALLARRPWLAAVALACWLAAHRHRHGSAAGLLVCGPAHLAEDVAEIAALVRGSARERTLLL